MSTTDSILCHYPNLLFGHEQLREGHIPLWNPYLFGGFDFTTSMHHHMLNPANWILALFPKEYALYVLTFIEFVEIAFIGLFSFKTFQFLHNSRMISFASALVVQLSGFTWFTTMTFIGVEFFFLAIVFIYLIISYEARRPIVNFILMALLSAAMLWEGHVGYIAAFFSPVITVQLVRQYKKLWKIRGNPNLIFACACLFGLGMALYRLYPILATPVENVISMLPAINVCSNGYKLLTGLIPAVFGIDLHTCGVLFEKMRIDGHIQFHTLLYFGLPTVFFFLLSLKGRFSHYLSALSWMTFLVILGSLFIFQPAVDLIYFILHPFVHSIVPRVGIAFLMFAIFYLSMRKLDTKKFQFSERDLRIFLVFGGMTLCFVMTFFFHLNLSEGPLSPFRIYLVRGAVALIFLFTVWSGIKFPMELSTIKSFNNWLLGIASATFLLFSGAFVCYCSHAIAPILFHYAIVIWSLSLQLLIRKTKLNRGYIGLLGLAALLLLYIAVFQNTGKYQCVSDSVDFMYPLMGALTFVVSFLVLWEIFAHMHHGQLSHRVFVLVLSLFLVGDLMFSLKICSYSGASSPFVKEEEIYPELSSWKRDRFSPVLASNSNEMITVFQNEKAVSRFSAFSNCLVTDNADELGRLLTGQDFHVDATVILERQPDGFEFEAPVKAEKLEYETIGTDKITLNLHQEKSRIILFNDTFHDGWRAKWNGNPIPVLLANGHFMAVCVPSGSGTLEFNFHPHMFFLLVKVSLFFGLILLLLSIYSVMTKLLRRRTV